MFDLGSLGVPGLASMVRGQASWLATMFGLGQDDIILAEANILAYPTVWMLVSARMISSWQSPNILASQDVWPPTMLARPGTPRDPKSHLFAAKWVAVAPFAIWRPGTYAELRRESQGVLPPQSQLFFTI